MTSQQRVDKSSRHTSSSALNVYPPPEGPPLNISQKSEVDEKGLHDPLVKQPSAHYGKWETRARLALALFLPTFFGETHISSDETLDYTVVATAQPHIASSFNRLDIQSWIGTSYVLTSTVFLPIYGEIADVFGRHWALQIASVLFLIGSALCTGAQSMAMMLVGRGISGIGAAGFVSVVRVIMSDSQSLAEDTFLSSMLIVLYAIGYSVGPVIGGYLLQASFRWIFAINLPSTFVSMILAFFLIRKVVRPAQPSRRLAFLSAPPPSDRPRRRRDTLIQRMLRIDWVGTLIFIGGGILILLALSLGSSVEAKGFKAPVVIACFVVGFLLIFVLIIWEYALEQWSLGAEDEANGVTPRRLSNFAYHCPNAFQLTEPMLPLDIFKNYDVCVTSFAALTGGMVLFSAFYFLSIYFSIVKGLKASAAGVQLLLFAPGMGAGVVIALRVIRWLKQPRYPSIVGVFLIPVGIGLLSMAILNDNQKQIDGFLFMTGMGIGLTFAPLSLQARFQMPMNRVAIVVTMNLFFRTAGGTIGLAQLSAILNTKVKGYITAAIADPTYLTPQQKQQIAGLFGGKLDSIQGIFDLDDTTRAVVQDAFRRACHWSFISLIPWCAVAALLCLGLHNIPDEVLNRTALPGAVPDAPAHDDPNRHGHHNYKATDTTQTPEADTGPPDARAQRPKPWQQVPTPWGPITALIWPIRVLIVWLRQRGE